MSDAVRIFRIVLASPIDVEADWRVVEKVIDELNEGLAPELNLLLRLSTWKTDTYPGFHTEGPQGLIDDALRLETADALVGLFWTRFGTPVKDASSGTEHEIRRAVQMWRDTGRPNVMVYFKEAPYNPRTQAELNQWAMVRDFRSSFPLGGLWRGYSTKSQFEAQIRRDLTNLLRVQHGRPNTVSRRRKTTGTLTVDDVEPLPYAASFLSIPRAESRDEYRYTLNVMLSNLASVKLTDYDVELAFPSEFLIEGNDVGVDTDVSTLETTIYRAPMPASTLPPPVFPGQTRNVLSVKFAVRRKQPRRNEALLKRVTSTIRFIDGRSLKLDTPIRDLHESMNEPAGVKMRRSDRESEESIDYTEFTHMRPINEVSFRGDTSSSEAFSPLNYGLRRKPSTKR